MEKVVFVNSFHSDSVRHIARAKPETVVSFDSHLDTYLWHGLLSKFDRIFGFLPELTRSVMLRASSHSMLRFTLKNSEIVIVQPEICTISDFLGKLEFVERCGVPYWKYLGEEPLTFSDIERYLSMLGLELYTSPPEKLSRLEGDLEGGDVAVDVDVDYFAELQPECYTPWKEWREIEGFLGSVMDFLRFIKKVKPKVIAISEAKLEALQDKESIINAVLRVLKNYGYKIRFSRIVPNDREAYRLMRLYEEFEFEVGRVEGQNLKNAIEGNGDYLSKVDVAKIVELAKKKFQSDIVTRY